MIKKTGLTIFSVFTVLLVAAQPKSGDFLLGGSASFSRNRGETPDNAGAGVKTKTQFSFNPNVGIFFSKRFAGGFSTSFNYFSSANSYVLRDSANNEFRTRDQYFNLTFGFGLFGSHYIPLKDKLYLVNTLDVKWGSYVEGDRLQSLLAENKPQQDRVNFLEMRHYLSLQYFMKPAVAVSIGFSPLIYTYRMNKSVRDNVPKNTISSHEFQFYGGARSLFISIHYLIISDNDNE